MTGVITLIPISACGKSEKINPLKKLELLRRQHDFERIESAEEVQIHVQDEGS